MDVREFGSTGLNVSALGFGAGHIGSPEMGEADAERLLNQVLDSGITLVDTAKGYGLSEERIGRHLSRRRDEFVLSTKCGYSIPGEEDWTYGCIKKGINLALETLQTDRIDIMHLHSCERGVLENNGVIDALCEAQDEGKIVSAAYSGENENLDYAIATGRFSSIQCSVNLCEQRGIDRALAAASERGMGVIAKRPLANAFWRFRDVPTGEYCEEYWHRAKAMGLAPGDIEWAEYAIRFAAFAPGVSSIIVGTSNIDHLTHNIAAAEKWALPDAIVTDTRERFSAHDNGWTGQV